MSRLLRERKTSIEILTKEFTLDAIAAVAKQLLDEEIFESLPRAKLRYPELFQTSKTQEADRAASEAEVIRIEDEAAQNIVLTSDDEGEEECLEFDRNDEYAEPKEALDDNAEVSGNVHQSAAEV